MNSLPLISSASNSRFKHWRSLLEPRGIRKHQQYLLSGEKALHEHLSRDRAAICEVLISHHLPVDPGLTHYKISRELFAQLDIFGTNSPLLVLKCPEIPPWQAHAPGPGVTVLCPLGDPLNLGAALRSAAAFQVRQFVLLQEASTPFHPKSIRACSGQLPHIPLRQGPSIQHFVRPPNDTAKNATLVALDAHGVPLHHFQWPASVLLLVGEEGPGLPTGLHAQTVRIPMAPSCESLNAATSLSIALYDYQLKHVSKSPKQ